MMALIFLLLVFFFFFTDCLVTKAPYVSNAVVALLYVGVAMFQTVVSLQNHTLMS